MHRIAIIEDDRAISKGLVRGLSDEGFQPTPSYSGEEGLRQLQEKPADLILLDIRLPGISGMEVLKALRSRGDTTPVIILTARDEEIDKVLGLETGADDYMVKPFGFRELVSRIHAQLRRSSGDFAASGADTRFFGNTRVDTRSLRVYRGGDEVILTPIELKLLLHFLNNPGISMSRNTLIEAVWGYGYALEDERTVDVHIRHLREKLEENPSAPRFIITVRGFGYRFDDAGGPAKIKKP